MKMNKKLNSILIVVISVLLCAGVALAAEQIINNYYGNTEVNNVVQGQDAPVLGGVTAVGGACNGSEPATQLCNINMYETEIQTDLTVTDVISYGGVESDWIEGSCGDATTTAFSVVNPWSADAYVDRVLIDITNGTTTISFDIGTSSTAYEAPTEVVADDVAMSTSTVAKITNTSGTIATVAGFTDPGTNSQDLFVWSSSQYINMLVTETGSTGGITNSVNTFSCTYKIHSFK